MITTRPLQAKRLRLPTIAWLLAALLVLTDALRRPLRRAGLALRCWHLRRRIAWAREEIEVIDHYAEVEPRRKRALQSAIGGMETRLILLERGW